MLKSKKGMELQINFIVMLIIALVVFGMGISIAMKIFGSANELKDDLDNQAEQQVLSYLNSGKLISVGMNRKEIKTGDSETFALALMNKYSKPIRYAVIVEDTFIAVDKNNDKIAQSDLIALEIGDISSWTFPRRPSSGYYKLERNEQEAIPLAFRVPSKAIKGLYAFTVKVFYEEIEPTVSGDSEGTEGTGTPVVSVSSSSSSQEFLAADWKLFNNQPQKIYIEVK